MDEHLQTVNQIKSTAIDLAMKFGPKLMVALLIIVVGVLVARWVGRMFLGVLERFELEPPVRQLLVRIAKGFVIGLFGIMALQNLGVELLPLIAGLGVAGAGVALAMQGVLGNVVAGLTIIFTKPFRVGEYISIVHEEGQVETISVFSTVLTHPDRSRVVIPNRKIVGEILHNYGRIRQLDIVVGVAYDTDVNQALAAVHEVVDASPMVLKDPAPLIQIKVLADSSINIAVKPWVSVDDFGPANGDLNKAVLEIFRARHIVIPFPQREVRMIAAG